MTASDAAGPQRILLVEDDLLIREMYQTYLQGKGFTVGTACDGEDALRVVTEFKPELIFLDIMMPKMDGLQLLRILREDPKYDCQKCKIVLLTNLGDNTIAERVGDQIDGYAIKAEITLADLVNIIRSLNYQNS